ncbi:MAG: GldG family protein [Treponema sp.]|nr:GldG family protein [Treponema sp.]
MTKRQTIIITALTIAAFILALLVSSRFWFRLDLTENKAYTISAVSRNIHREIPDIINITYYLSDRLKTITPSVGEIEDMLSEYAAYSRGKIRVTTRDPVKTGLARTIEDLGFQPRQVQSVEQDQASLTTVYSGLVIEYLDRIDILPWIISTETLEYDLTTRIRSIVNNTERVIGVLIGDSYRAWQEDFNYMEMILMDAGFKIRLLTPREDIPDTLPALFVLGGSEDLDPYALYKIDRYIQLGGKAMFCVDGVFVDIFDQLQARQLDDLGLINMISIYGAIILPELALDRDALMIRYEISTSSGLQYRTARYPLWIGVQPRGGNPGHPVTAGFAGLDLYWASPLEMSVPDGVSAEVLFATSHDAWSMKNNLYTNPEMSYLLELDADETRGPKILGVSLSGAFPSFFRGFPKPEFEGYAELADLPPFAGESRIIVIGDLDFATNMMNVTQNINFGEARNLDFILRAADWLVNDDDIVGIRNRQPRIGRFDKIADETRRTAAMRFSQALNVVIIPLLVIIAGVLLSLKRKKAANASARRKTFNVQDAKNNREKEADNDV